MTAKQCRNSTGVLAALGFILYLIVCFGGCNQANAATWTFTVPASLINDTYMNGYTSSQNTNYESIEYIMLGWSYGARTAIVGSSYISDSLSAHGGTVDSFKLVLKLGIKDNDFIDGDSMKINWNALKVIPVTSELTWNAYSYGNNWQTAGALGANDQYTPNESDGVHGDSVMIRYATATGDSIVLWGDPDHASAEWWVIRGTVMAIDADARIYIRSVHYGTASLRPYFIFYGTEGEAPAITTTAKIMTGLRK